MPDISVIMPTFNRGSAIGRAVRSVLDQENANFELIIVDDGSTDDTARRIADLNDDRIMFLRNPNNIGGNASRNRGIEIARAPLIAFLDDDDYYLPNKLETEVITLNQRPDVDVLVHGFVKEFPPSKNRPMIGRRNPIIETNAEFVDALFLRQIRKSTSGIALRRDAALRVGGFDATLRRQQDFDFLLRLAKFARCVTTSELLWVKTFPADSISEEDERTVPSMLEFYRRHPEYYEDRLYRQGFALDLGRHFSRVLRRGKKQLAFRDLRTLRREFGGSALLQLLLTGRKRHREYERAQSLADSQSTFQAP